MSKIGKNENNQFLNNMPFCKWCKRALPWFFESLEENKRINPNDKKIELKMGKSLPDRYRKWNCFISVHGNDCAYF